MIFHILMYLTIGMCFISVVWIHQSMRKLTKGMLRELIKYLLGITLWGLLLSIWVFSIGVGWIKLPNESFTMMTIGSFIAGLFLIISGIAMYAKKMGEVYGFKD
ncbi:MAG: hypothetical protein JW778_06390 [Candidatus Altiarchaeota archaeon]|nr:hypothetical protein [Candidatus Altiarchaeota archaeon]